MKRYENKLYNTKVGNLLKHGKGYAYAKWYTEYRNRRCAEGTLHRLAVDSNNCSVVKEIIKVHEDNGID